jgi:hypothetical protein
LEYTQGRDDERRIAANIAKLPGSLTQIKVIFSGRAEIRLGRCKFGHLDPNKSKGIATMHSYSAPAVAIAMIMPAILSARSDDIPTLDVNPVCHCLAEANPPWPT